MTTKFVRRNTNILVLNPNSSSEMTLVIERAIKSVELLPSTQVFTYTAPPESPKSINDGQDIAESTGVVYRDLETTPLFEKYDAVLVACFSVHPLVAKLQAKASLTPHGSVRAVTGIFEASILTCLSLVAPHKKWGIVTTGKFWEDHLVQGVNDFLGAEPHARNSKFIGVETTGLDAGDFHSVSPAVIREKLSEATRRLLAKGQVDCVVMGCAGMAGLEEIIRSVAVETYGLEVGRKVLIIDGVKAGVGLLEQMVRNKQAFS
ncbi:hypothetical protein VTK26DRAFT_4456 [Humicola hyalothermophila]